MSAKDLMMENVAHINSPSEGSDSGSNNRILVDSNDFMVLQDSQGLCGGFREL